MDKNQIDRLAKQLGATKVEVLDRMIERHNLPVVHQTEPVIAWKLANFYGSGATGGLEFHPITGHDPYGVKAIAQCFIGRISTHKAPALYCSCGFYGLKSVSRVGFYLAHTFLLKVEFSGRVIECDLGYRAERQKIIAVYYGETTRFFDRHNLRVLLKPYGIPLSGANPLEVTK